MTFKRLLLLLLLAVLIVLIKPSILWDEASRIWSQRETILRLLVLVVGLYLLYGLYTIWSANLAWW